MADKIHNSNQRIEDLLVESGMIKESQRLGRNYRMAQLYNSKSLRNTQTKEHFKQMLVMKMAGRPSNEPSDAFPNGFLKDQFDMTEDQFNKLGLEEVTVGDTKFDIETGRMQREEILYEWSGTDYDKRVSQLESDLLVAEQTLANLNQEAITLGSMGRRAEVKYKNASIEVATNLLKLRVAAQSKAKAERDALKLQRDKLKNQEELAIREQNERLKQFHNTGKYERKYRRKAKSDVKDAEDLLQSLEAEPLGAAKEDIDLARTMLIEADIEADKGLKALQAEALDAAAVEASLKRVYGPQIDRIRGRLGQMDKQIKALDKRVESFNPQIEKLTGLVDKAKIRQAQIERLRVDIRAAKKAADTEVRKARRGVRKAKKGLKKGEAKAPVHVYVDELVNNMSKGVARGQIGQSFLDPSIYTSGRTMWRQIEWTAAERSELVDAGILRGDVMDVMQTAHTDLSARWALKDTFGSEDLTDVVNDIEVDYKRLIDEARASGNTKKADRLAREFKDVEKHIYGVRDRHLNRLGRPENPEDLLHWSTRKGRQFAFNIYGSGFLVSSLTDPANVAFIAGFKSFRQSKRLRKMFNGMGNNEIRRIVIHSEKILTAQRNFKLWDAEDTMQSLGVGDYGTMRHAATSSIDRVGASIQKGASLISGMQWWNTRLKAMALLELQHNLAVHASKLDEIFGAATAGNRKAILELEKWKALGLGETQLRLISKQIKKHKPIDDDGSFELEMGRWLDDGAEGQRAYETVTLMLNRAANRAVMTPGSGDTPLLMSNAFGKMLMQFQTFGFANIIRYVTPALQRGISYGDMEALLTMGLTAALGTGVVHAKDLLRTGEIQERTDFQWAYDVIDRSGYLMHLTVPSAALLKISGLGNASRYKNSHNGDLSLLLGPTGMIAKRGMGLGSALMEGDSDAVGRQANRLLPYQIIHQLFDRVITDNK